MKDRYQTFKENEQENWRYRFTWRGIYGDKGYHAIAIFKFFNETNAQEKLRGVKNVNDFYKKVTTLANSYKDWCGKKEEHTPEELADIWNFFVGAMGEFFFTYLLDDIKSVICTKDGKGKRYDFNYVAPLLKGERDWGIDMTGSISDEKGDRNCVVQVKFWNPFTSKGLQIDVMQKAFAEGILNNFIYPNEYHNVVICWLGDEEASVSRFLKQNEPLNEHVILVGKKALNYTINERNGIFWDNLVNKLKEFSNK